MTADDFFDDTIDDSSAPPDLSQDQRQWLAEQRLVHGLLRSMATADAAGREHRVETILESVGVHRPHRRAWGLAAAALLLAGLMGYLLFQGIERLPQAKAMMSQALNHLSSQVDRTYRLTAELHSDSGKQDVVQAFLLTTRPGKKFLLEGQITFDPRSLLRMGCDGEMLWALMSDPAVRWSGPLDRREKIAEFLGKYLDVEFFDLHKVISTLGWYGRVDLRAVQRLPGMRAGEGSVIRVEATCETTDVFRIERAEFLIEEATGLLTYAELSGNPEPGLTWKLSLDYSGEVDPGEDRYRRPW